MPGVRGEKYNFPLLNRSLNSKNYSARVLKPDGTYASYNEPGELLVYSPSNALAYFNNEQA